MSYKPCKLATYEERRYDWNNEDHDEKEYCYGCEKSGRMIAIDTYDGSRDNLCYRCFMKVGFVYYNDCKGCENCYRESEDE